MIQENQKGFTLVELLVTVGIIGILATIIVASLSGTRGRARDAQRISDVKQFSALLDAEASSEPGSDDKGITLTTCGAGADINTCTNTGTIKTEDFQKFKDPGVKATSPVCVKNGVAVCRYGIADTAGTAAGKTGDYQICFYLETSGGVDGEAGKVNSLTRGGKVVKN